MGTLRLPAAAPAPGHERLIVAATGLLDGTVSEPVFVLPGLTNSHDHLEFNSYPRLGRPPYRDAIEWGLDVQSREAETVAAVAATDETGRVEAGILKNLVAGVTTVVEHGVHRRESATLRVHQDYQFIHSADLHPLPWALWRRDTRPVVMHIGEGDSARCRTRARRFLRWKPPSRDIVGVHGIALGQRERKCLRALVWCPVSNHFLFGCTLSPQVAGADTTLLFGTDSAITSPGDLWSHLRAARGSGGISDAALFATVSTSPRDVWGLDDRDRVLVRRSGQHWDALFATRPEDVLLVVIADRVCLVDETLAALVPDADGPGWWRVVVGGAGKRVRVNADLRRSAMDRLGADLTTALGIGDGPAGSVG